MSFREEGPVELMLISRPDFPKIGWKFIYIIHTFKFVQVDRILDLAKPGSNIMLSSQNFSLVTKYKTLIYDKKHYILWQLYWCIFMTVEYGPILVEYGSYSTALIFHQILPTVPCEAILNSP